MSKPMPCCARRVWPHALCWIAIGGGLTAAPQTPDARAEVLGIGDDRYDLDALPRVAEGFVIEFVAKEPQIQHPAALAFDARGRMFVSGGPQFRKPTPDTPPDSVYIMVDENGDGKAESFKVFATGFNNVQGLAFKGRDLYVANAPDMTIVRDTDGDDVADTYIRLYEGLGHLRHGLHGLNFGPDGKLYMSQGNSQVQDHAPNPFRDLMGVESKAPATQTPKRFPAQSYKHTYIKDWPSAEGGILRADADGSGLEIFSRGNRNPFDLGFDDGFNWIGTDNDEGPEHDRVFNPFFGAHFGKRHPWQDAWDGKDAPAGLPVAALFPNVNGSGVGVDFYTAGQFPPRFDRTFIIGDWIQRSIYHFVPRWEGAQMVGTLEEIVNARGNESLFRPTDLATGPDGALYILGWGSHYGSTLAPFEKGDDQAPPIEGRIFRLRNKNKSLIPRTTWDVPHRKKSHATWSLDALIADLDHHISAWRVNAQDELLARGDEAARPLRRRLQQRPGCAPDAPSQQMRTWILWTLGRGSRKSTADKYFVSLALDSGALLPDRITAVRVLGHRKAGGAQKSLARLLQADNPRLRFEAVQTLRALGMRGQRPALLDLLAGEKDRLVRYVAWQTLAHTEKPVALRALLKHEAPGVKEAALLALMEKDALSEKAIAQIAQGQDETLSNLAHTWLKKAGTVSPQKASTVPAQAQAPQRFYETTAAQIIPLVPKGDAQRGKTVFFRPGGPGCSLCHQLGGQGTAVGPDLADFGQRSNAAYAIESILQPSAKIIEGYMQAVVTTHKGQQFAGMVREESGRMVRLYQADGVTVNIAQKDIAKRELLDVSAMPEGYNNILSAQDVADLCAWLMSQKGKTR